MAEIDPFTSVQYGPDDLILFGGGGHAKTLIDLIRTAGRYHIHGVVDDGIVPGTQILGVPVLGGSALLPLLAERGMRNVINAVGGIGNVDLRARIFEMLAQFGFQFPTVAHPGAVIEPSSTLADGVAILALAYVGSDVEIGFGSVLNVGAIVSHDCKLGRVVNLSPNASLAGGVLIGDYTQIGMNATVNINLKIGARVRIGNSATIKQDVPDGGRVYAGAIWPPRTVVSHE